MDAYGGEREPHRLLSAPLALSANVFTSLTADEFTVNGPKVSTILSTLLQRLGSLQRLYSPTQVTMPPPYRYKRGRTFWGGLGL